MAIFYRDPSIGDLIEIYENPFEVTLDDSEQSLTFIVQSNQNISCTEEEEIGLEMSPYVRWDGDTEINGVNGTGSPGVNANNSSGTISSSFNIYDSFGVAQGPDTGLGFKITFYSEDDQQLASATYDYSSVVDMVTDTPITSSGATYIPPATYSDTDTTPVILTYSDFLSHMVSCTIDSNGLGSFLFNKNDFATANGFINANAFIYKVTLQITSSFGNSSTSTMEMCVASSDGKLFNPYVLTPVANGRSIVFGNSTTIQGIGDITYGTCGTFGTIRAIDTTANTRYGVACQNTTVNSETPWFVGSGSSQSNLRYYYRNTDPDAFDWSTLYTSESIATDLQLTGISVDDVNNVNTKPVLYTSIVSSGGSFITTAYTYNIYMMYWDGSSWDHSDVTINTITKIVDYVDPSTLDIYVQQQNDFGVYRYTGPDFSFAERTDPSNYSSFEKIMDIANTAVDGETNTGVCPKHIYANYAGHYNGEPSFSMGFSSSPYWAWVFYNGSAWETKILMSFTGTSSSSQLPSSNVTESTMNGFNVQYIGSVAQANFPNETSPSSADMWYFFDYINDIIYRGTFESGSIDSSTWEMSIEEYVPEGTGAVTTTLY